MNNQPQDLTTNEEMDIAEDIDQLATDILEKFKSRATNIMLDGQNSAFTFENDLQKHWGNALKLLEMFLVTSKGIGADLSNEYGPTAKQSFDYTFQALIRLHARACLTASEIFTLLNSGYAAGAYSRCRTLHEISVIAFFILESGKDTAERYLSHDVVESYKAANEYKKKFDAFKDRFEGAEYEQIGIQEFESIKKMRDQLLSHFGENFDSDYGWAAKVLNKSDKYRPTFADIEEAVDLAHLRVFYKLASQEIHIGTKGVFTNMGLPQKKPVLLVGQSIYGLADPGQWAAIALN